MSSITVVRTTSERFTQSLLIASISLVGIGAIIGLVGAYWDDAWHTDMGRDTFWSPPHLLLYSGPALVTVAVSIWAWLAYHEVGSLRATLRQRILLLGLVGAVVTPLSAPIDDYWHTAFGRDSILWSPPHMLGVVGIFALVSAALLRLSQMPGRAGRWLTLFSSGLMVAALLALVFEYESDVPQFSVVWYLPLLTFLAALTFGLCYAVSDERWLAGKAAAIYTVLMVGVILVLMAMDHSTPIVPIILFPALVFDLGAQRGWSRPLWAAAFALALYASYAPYLNFLLGGIYLTLSDLLLGLPVAFLAAWLALLISGRGEGRMPRRLLAAVLALLIGSLLAQPALAHDPGQGQEVGEMAIRVTQAAALIQLDAQVIGVDDCAGLEPLQMTARRAGQTLQSALVANGQCRFAGEMTLPERGRWFVYTELSRGAERLEAWLPVIAAAETNTTSRQASLYVVPRRTAWGSSLMLIAGVALYLIEAGIAWFVIHLFRQEARQRRPLPIAP